MVNLLKNKFLSVQESELELKLSIEGESNPSIGDPYKYTWRLEVIGSNEYKYIEDLRIEFAFENEDVNYYIIEDCSFKIDDEKSDELPKATIKFPLIDYEIPLSFKSESVLELATFTNIKWYIKNINLSHHPKFSRIFSGDATIKFYSVHEPFKINMKVTPQFCKKRLLNKLMNKHCIFPPRITSKEVIDNCIDINPKNTVERFSSIELSNNGMMFSYNMISDDGKYQNGILIIVPISDEQLHSNEKIVSL